jgi:hypothetical protein
MTIRHLNYTGRKRIPAKAVTVAKKSEDKDATQYIFNIKLGEVLEDREQVDSYLELYKGTYYQKRQKLPEMNHNNETELTLEVPAWAKDGSTFFRIKVVDENSAKLIAYGDQFRLPVDSRNHTATKSLLPIIQEEIGTVWKVALNNGRGAKPYLVLNQEIDGIMGLVSDDTFKALIYPQVLKEILIYFFIQEEYSEEHLTPDEPASEWLQFARRHSEENLPTLDGTEGERLERRRDWIESCVSQFATSLNAKVLMEDIIDSRF